MEQPDLERRRWERMRIDSEAELKIPDAEQTAKVLDISGGGALLSVSTEALSEDPMGLSIVNVGNYEVAVVRQWGDKVAVKFDHNEDKQYSLQEELETFCLENDFSDDE